MRILLNMIAIQISLTSSINFINHWSSFISVTSLLHLTHFATHTFNLNAHAYRIYVHESMYIIMLLAGLLAWLLSRKQQRFKHVTKYQCRGFCTLVL